CQMKPRCQASGVRRSSAGTIAVAAKNCNEKVAKRTASRISRSRGIGPAPKPPRDMPRVEGLRMVTATVYQGTSRIAQPLPQLLEGRLLAVHEDAHPVDARRDPDGADDEAEGQRVGEEELPERRHLERDAQRHQERGEEREERGDDREG